jgi:hypothetical protein
MRITIDVKPRLSIAVKKLSSRQKNIALKGQSHEKVCEIMIWDAVLV